MTLSAVVITRNAGAMLDRCLASVAFADELSNNQVLFHGGDIVDCLVRKGYQTGVHVPGAFDLTFIRNTYFEDPSRAPDLIKETIENAKAEGITLYEGSMK